MKTSFEKLYEHVGYLFYALAAEHGKLSSADYLKLKEIIDRYWAGSAHGDLRLQPYLNGYVLSLNGYLLSGVRNAIDEGMDADEAFLFFENYYAVHKLFFGSALKEKIALTDNSIAAVFPGNNHQRAVIKNVEELLELKPVTK